MNLKFILCFGLTMFSVSSVTNSVNVKCSYDDIIETCIIKEVIDLESGDHLNITTDTAANEITQIIFPGEHGTNASRLVSFPSNIFQQFRSVEEVNIRNVSMEHFVKESLRNAKKLTSLELSHNKIKMIPANVLSLAKKLETFYLQNNEISDIKDYAFNSTSLRELYLSGNKLKSIKENIFMNATKCESIDLSGNFIENIENGAFDLPELETIILDENKLKTLPTNLFADAPKLLSLSLRANELSIEIVHAFGKAAELTELNLNDNPTLSGLNLLFLRELPQLQTLNLRNTSLTDSTIANLANAEKLTSLDLSNNKIERIPANVIALAPKLESLELQKNEISEIEDYAFNSSSLRILHLSGNKLKSIRRNIFNNATQCEFIDLTDNMIDNIEEGAFDLHELESIYLDNNNLKTLSTNVFANAPKLLCLRLGANQLSTDIVLSLEKATELKELYLDDNPTLSGVNLLSLRKLTTLDTLNLSNTSLTKSTIENLPDSPSFSTLIISNNNLTDKRLLYHLSRLSSLQYLEIPKNNFTKLSGFNRIASLLPSLKSIDIKDNQWNCAWIESSQSTCQTQTADDDEAGFVCDGLPPKCE